MRATFAVPTATNKADSGFFVLSMLRRLCKGAEPMTTQPLSAAQIVPTTRQKAMLALSFLALSTLGMIHPANAKEVTYIIFDPPGSTYTQPNSINRKGAITGSYRDAQFVNHGFQRDRDEAITSF